MAWALDDPAEDELTDWIERSVGSGEHALARGHQGQVYLFERDGRRLIVKVASGSGLLRRLRTLMLRREYRAYRRLAGFAGAPSCYGFLRDRFLVLEYIEGVPRERAQITDRDAFFRELLGHIQDLHARGVAHGDLQKKDNLLVVDGRHPCMIDFGTAVVWRPGFAPLNHYAYRFAARLDFNVWAKLKYRGRLTDMSDADRGYYRRSTMERLARWTKRAYRHVRSWVARQR